MDNMQYNNDNENNSKSNTLAILSLILLLTPIIILLALYTSNVITDALEIRGVHNSIVTLFEIIACFSPIPYIIGLVIMIYLRVKYNDNKLGKVAMIMYVIVGVVVAAFLIIMATLIVVGCTTALNQCGEIGSAIGTMVNGCTEIG